MVDIEKLQDKARKLLEEEKIRFLIGYTGGAEGKGAVPARFRKPEEVEKLIWNPECRHNLVLFLVEEKKKEIESKEEKKEKKPIGLLVKGCDSRIVNVLLQEKFISREEVFLLGVSCEQGGIIDRKKASLKLNGKKVDKWEFEEDGSVLAYIEGKKTKFQREDILSDNCLVCRYSYPVTYDVLFGEKKEREVKNQFKSVEEIENMPREKIELFWKEQMEKCIRCYACRSVCPLCYCPECVVDSISFKITPETTA
ncbi:MAG: hydrogenase, partial [Acidobacteriota bacterium]